MKQKRLYRSKDDRMIAGVCGGIAEYFEIDPVIVRLFAIALVFFDGIGILAYLVGWIIIPLKDGKSSFKGKRLYRSSSDRMVAGICGGLGEYFDVDSTIVRLIAVISIFFGIGLIAYLIGWIVIPLDKSKKKVIVKKSKSLNFEKKKIRKGRFVWFFGSLLILIGFSFLYSFEKVFPFFILAFGLYLIYRSFK